jgi:hypothetical protein
MPVRLVTYDLNNERKARDGYAGLLKEIKKYPWARLSESSYAISTAESPKEVYDKLKPHTDSDDDLMVITLTAPWWGKRTKEVYEWLRQNL